MMEPVERSDLVGRLKTTLNSVALPDRLSVSGRALADRLSAPVRLAFIGSRGAGKTTLIRALLGTDIPNMQADLPSHVWVYGQAPKAHVTLAEGTVLRLDGADAVDGEAILARNPVFVTFEVPCERLRRVRVLEVVTDGSDDDLAAAARWAAQRCEIPIWCSTNFKDPEAKAWAGVPWRRKNHSILALTQADKVSSGTLSARMERADARSDTGFCIIAPVAAKAAMIAQDVGHKNAERVAKSTGIAALQAEIFRRVEEGRQHDLDHAEVFLTRFESAQARPTSQPLTAVDVTAPNDMRKSSEYIREGADFLSLQTKEMLKDIEEFGQFAPKRIVERCLETANALMDQISDGAPVGVAQTLAHNAASDAADMLLLMTLENTAGAAEDAVNLILQVKREFELAA